MNNMIKLIITFLIFSNATSIAFASADRQALSKTKAIAANDLQRLQNLWQNYQHNVTSMNNALAQIKNEKDEQKKNMCISTHNNKLEQIKNTLNQLILTENLANQLRQQIIEHATKYQGVYKLAAIENPTTTQLNVFQRLNGQTSSLYQKMLNTAQQLK